ncbi:MAG: hypothetical protein QGG40_05450, partial [Myxococcota bacterium]|nr:hypothetical protein [Myxococcota bacterium]
DECGQGIVYVAARVLNRGEMVVSTGVAVALYAVIDGSDVLLDTATTSGPMDPGWSSDAIGFEIGADLLTDASALWLKVDDDGAGSSAVEECSELNNGYLWGGPFCE